MFHGEGDELTPFASAYQTYLTWCDNGASVQFVSETGGTGHLGTGAVLVPSAVSWLDLRLSGTPPEKACFETSVNTAGFPLRRDEGGSQ